MLNNQPKNKVERLRKLKDLLNDRIRIQEEFDTKRNLFFVGKSLKKLWEDKKMLKKPKMVLCRNCNTQIAKNAKICPSCGAKNKKPFFKRWWFALFIVILVLGGIGSINRNKKEKFDWGEVELRDRLPKPKSNVGTIIDNDSEHLSLHIEKTSKADYNTYIEECQSMGYTVESEKNGDNYTAFDKDSYGLDLSYIGETMYLTLDAPIEMGTLKWPKSEIAGLLPLPKSTVGKVSTDTENGCYIYVGETSIDDFNAYADECSDNGFSVDYERGDEFYNAKDETGNKLSLSYQGNDVMVIQIRKSDETEANAPETEQKQESEPTSATEQQTEAAEKSSDGMRPEFKQAMDSYEEFMNEYCEFMKKYAESDGSDAGLLADYAKYMSKYADVVEDFEAWDDGEMNKAETAYYLDVQTRINKKLLEVE